MNVSKIICFLIDGLLCKILNYSLIFSVFVLKFIALVRFIMELNFGAFIFPLNYIFIAINPMTRIELVYTWKLYYGHCVHYDHNCGMLPLFYYPITVTASVKKPCLFI